MLYLLGAADIFPDGSGPASARAIVSSFASVVVHVNPSIDRKGCGNG